MKVTFIVPQRNGYTLPTITSRVIPHIEQIEPMCQFHVDPTGNEKEYTLRSDCPISDNTQEKIRWTLRNYYGFVIQ